MASIRPRRSMFEKAPSLPTLSVVPELDYSRFTSRLFSPSLVYGSRCSSGSRQVRFAAVGEAMAVFLNPLGFADEEHCRLSATDLVPRFPAGSVPQAKEHGFGMVGTFNTSTSTGSIGYYAKAIADAGLIAFCFAQSPEVRKYRSTGVSLVSCRTVRRGSRCMHESQRRYRPAWQYNLFSLKARLFVWGLVLSLVSSVLSTRNEQNPTARIYPRFFLRPQRYGLGILRCSRQPGYRKCPSGRTG